MKHKGILILAIAVIFVFSGCGKKDNNETGALVEQEQYTETEAPQETVTQEEPAEVTQIENSYERPTAESSEKEVEEKVDLDEGPAIYSVQLVSLPDLSRVQLQQEIMEKDGVETVISQFEKDGIPYFRLRLAGKYTKARAEMLGDQMKEKFWSITDYWVFK